MKTCLLVLFLTSTILAINTPRATAQSASKHNSLDLHYYHEYKANQHNMQNEAKEIREANKFKNPAETFHQQQNLRGQAYNLKEKILDSKRETQQAELKAGHHVEAVKSQINNFENQQKNSGDQLEAKNQQLKYKINHSEKFRQVYEHRAEENAASAMVQPTVAQRNQKQDLAKWDHKQEQHYASEAEGDMKQLAHNKKDVESREAGIAKKLENMHKDLEAAKKDTLTVEAKGAERVERLEHKSMGVEQRLHEGVEFSRIQGDSKAIAQESKPKKQSDKQPMNHSGNQPKKSKSLAEEVASISFSTPVKKNKVSSPAKQLKKFLKA